MSTRSFIAKQIGEDQYRTIYCHSDGYLEHNGKVLLAFYNTPEQVDELLALGDLSFLDERPNPDPSQVHSFNNNERQEGVTLAYGRDRGEQGTEAKDMTLAQLDNPDNWTEFVYIFTPDDQWKYFETGQAEQGLRSVQDALDRLTELETEAPTITM